LKHKFYKNIFKEDDYTNIIYIAAISNFLVRIVEANGVNKLFLSNQSNAFFEKVLDFLFGWVVNDEITTDNSKGSDLISTFHGFPVGLPCTS